MKKKMLLLVSCMTIAAVAITTVSILRAQLPSQKLANAAAYYEAVQNSAPKNLNDIIGLKNSLSSLSKNDYIEDECVVSTDSKRKAQETAEKLDCTLICWSESTHNALLQINDGRTLPDLLDEIAESENIDYTTVPIPNYLYKASEIVTASDKLVSTDVGDYDNINDEFFAQKQDIIFEKVHLAWSGATGKGVTVAVIDTGIDYDHPDLANNISSLSARINNASISHEPTEYNDLHGHGTHVCGIIAAEGNNNLGVIGVAPEAELLSIKATTASNNMYFSYYNLIESIFYAVGCEADIINLSLGAPYSTGNNTELQAAVDFAESSGVIVVAAAGNDSAYHADYPAAYESVIAVSSVNSSGTFSSSFSNYGPEVDFAAVGQSVYSTVLDGKYGYKSGTSMATPNVSGAVALILSANPNASLYQICNMLKTNAMDMGNEGYDEYFGYGIIQMDFLAKKLTDGIYNYILLDDGTVKITSCVNSDTNLVIPSQIDGKAVTEIAANSFCNQTSLQSVSIPSTVTKIGNNAFSGCTSLSSVTTDAPNTSYGTNVFGESAGFKMFCNSDSDTSNYCEQNNIQYYYKDLTATGIQLDKSTVEIELAQTASVIASTTPNRVYGEFVWKSNDENIATVNDGVICSVSLGTTKITVTMGDFSAECNVIVKLSATSISLDKASATIANGETIQLLATAQPAQTTDTITWTSSDESIAKVNSNGIVTGVAGGKAKITVKAGNVFASCEIEVIQKAQGISLNQSSVNLGKNKTIALTASITPSNAAGKVNWSSSNDNIATVSTDGTVTAVGHGIAWITAEIDGVKATCQIISKPDLTIKMLGASIRMSDPYGLRFGIQIAKDAEYEITDIVEYGTIMLPTSLLEEDEELTLSTEQIRKIKAVNILSETESNLVYTAVLINIPTTGFRMDIVGRGYLIYKDADGTEHTIYTQTAMRSFYNVAQIAYNQYIGLTNPTESDKLIITQLKGIIDETEASPTTTSEFTESDPTIDSTTITEATQPVEIVSDTAD